MSNTRQHWAAIARMNVTLLRQAHAVCFPRTVSLADGLLLRVILQHVALWESESRPATVSKLARALGLSRATVQRKLHELITYGYIKRRNNHYVCAEKLEQLCQSPETLHRFKTIIATTARELEK